MSKTSIRFYNDRKVRAIWDEDKSKWWFSAVDIVAAITESPNPRKYWSVLKTRLRKSNDELTTKCSQLKLTVVDTNPIFNPKIKHFWHKKSSYRSL